MTLSSTAPARNTWTLQQSARIAGAAYLITNVTAEFNLFYARPRLFAAGDVALTAANIAAHAQLYRAAIVMDLLTVAGCVILNLALYELLSTVHLSFARLALFWRLVESAVYAAITVSSFVVLSIISGADSLQAFEPQQLNALVRLFLDAKGFGFFIAMLFLCLGSSVYCYLLVKSRYIPQALAWSGVLASVLGALGLFTYFLFPGFITSSFATVRTLPAAGLVLLAVILVPIFSFEFTIGFWLLIRGVRAREG